MPSPDPCAIDAELTAFMRGPVSAFLATADALDTPEVTRVVGLAGLDECRIRILVPTSAANAWRNAVVGAKVALLVTDITNYRSIQWKGRVESVDTRRSPGDTALVDDHITQFRNASAVVGLDPDESWRLFSRDALPIKITLDERFDQTPGPNAGLRTLDARR